jgi:hypothetical protein
VNGVSGILCSPLSRILGQVGVSVDLGFGVAVDMGFGVAVNFAANFRQSYGNWELP